MVNYTKSEIDFINSLDEPINDINIELINSIIDKMIINKKYEDLIFFLDALNDFAEVPKDFVDKLINKDDKECIASLLNNEESLYFLNKLEKEKLITFLNVKKDYIKLDDSYDFYYDMLFKQGIRPWKTNKIDENIIEYSFTKANQLLKFNILEINGIGLVVSYVCYLNYNLSKEEQVLKTIDYLNEFGFNIEKDNQRVIDEI